MSSSAKANEPSPWATEGAIYAGLVSAPSDKLAAEYEQDPALGAGPAFAAELGTRYTARRFVWATGIRLSYERYVWGGWGVAHDAPNQTFFPVSPYATQPQHFEDMREDVLSVGVPFRFGTRAEGPIAAFVGISPQVAFDVRKTTRAQSPGVPPPLPGQYVPSPFLTETETKLRLIGYFCLGLEARLRPGAIVLEVGYHVSPMVTFVTGTSILGAGVILLGYRFGP